MAGISESNLVSAVSNGGGLGTIGSGLMPPLWLKEEIKKTKEKTKEPFGINLFVLSKTIDLPIGTAYRGVAPFVVTDFFHVALLIAFPQISLFLVGMM